VARACGYPLVLKADSYEELDAALEKAKAADTLVLLEVSAGLGAREDLGRPTTSAKQNMQDFMTELAKKYV
jgi:phosphonopyruvate decarboxylase